MAQVIVDDDGGGGGSSELYVRRYFFVTGNPNGGTGGGNTGGYATCKPGDSYAVALNRLSVSRSGYGFRGWSTSSSGAVQYSASGYVVFNVVAGKDTYNLTLYAVWTRLSTLTYQANASGVTDVPAAVTAYQGSSNTLSSTYPKRSGYVFKGWNTKADGTGTMYQPGAKVTFSTGGNWNLYAIWKEPVGTISAGNARIGDAHTVTITNDNPNSLTFTVSYSVAGHTGWISGPTPSSNKNLSWTPGVDLAQYITNDTQATLTLTLSTYNGSSLVGTTTKNVLIYIPDYMVPSISSYTMTETAEIPEEFVGYWVREVSVPELNVVASGIYGSTIASYKVVYEGGTVVSTTNPFNIGVLNANGNLNATVTVTDSRGRTAATSINFVAYDHYMPSIMFGDVYRDSTSPSNIVVNYRHVIAPVNNLNTKKIKIGYKMSDESNYDYVSDIVPDVYSGDGSYTIANTNPAKIYNVKIQVIDSVGSSAEYFVDVPRFGGIYIDVNPDDDTIAMHGEAPGDGVDHWFEKILALEQGSSAASIKGNGSGYVRIAKLMSRVERSRNLAPKSSISSRHIWGLNVNSNDSGMLGKVFETLEAGTYTVSFKFKITAIPETVETLQYGTLLIYNSISDAGVHFITQLQKINVDSYEVGTEIEYKKTFVLSSAAVADADYYTFRLYCGQDSAFEASVSEFQIETGNTKTDFEPYVDMNNRDLTAPFYITYVSSGRGSERKITIQFDGSMDKVKFYLASTSLGTASMIQISETQWDLYVQKIDYNDIIDVINVVNPVRNKDLSIIWDDTVLSSLPSGSINATDDPDTPGFIIYQTPSSVSVPSSSAGSSGWKTIATITFPTIGRWFVFSSTRFATNATGIRWALLSYSSNSNQEITLNFEDTKNAEANTYTFCRVMDMRATTSNNETWYLNVWQNSGSALSTFGRIVAIRIS